MNFYYKFFYKLNEKDHWRKHNFNRENDDKAKEYAHNYAKQYNLYKYGVEKITEERIL